MRTNPDDTKHYIEKGKKNYYKNSKNQIKKPKYNKKNPELYYPYRINA